MTGRGGTQRGRPGRIRRIIAAGCAAIAVAACATLRPADDLRIVDVRHGRFVSETTLVDALAAARYRLLGERHDNATHHVLRARLAGALVQRGLRPAVVLEAFDLEHDEPLRAAQRENVDAERLADAGRLDRRAWQWPLHRPIVDAALAARLPIRAGNLSRARIGELVAQNDAARFANVQWSASQQAALVDDIVDGHCRKLPADAVPRLVLAQRLRDDAMAQALVDAATGDGALLAAGNGHVRNDVGVTPYLRAREPQARVVSVAFVEVDAGDTASPAQLVATHAGYDYLVLTATVARRDPCATLASTRIFALRARLPGAWGRASVADRSPGGSS